MSRASSRDLSKRMSEARDSGDLDGVAKLALEAFADDCDEEDLLAWVTKVVYEEDLAEAFSVIPQFVTRFPRSRSGVRVYLADSLAERGEFDRAADEARQYLVQVHERGELRDCKADPMVEDWIQQALLLVGTGYCVAGARSLGQQVFTFAISLTDDPGFRLSYEQEILRTERELTELDNREVDYFWRSFIEKGTHHDQVQIACEETGMPLLARRAAMLHGERRSDPGFLLPELEMMLGTQPELSS